MRIYFKDFDPESPVSSPGSTLDRKDFKVGDCKRKAEIENDKSDDNDTDRNNWILFLIT